MLQNLPVLVSLHPARYEDLRRDSFPARRASPILPSLTGNHITLKKSPSGDYDQDPGYPNSSENSTRHIIDLGSTRLASSYRLDYLQEQKLDAYRRASQFPSTDEPLTSPTIDIYV